METLDKIISKTNYGREKFINFFMAGLNIMPTKLQREKVEYMVVTYMSVIFCCIFPYIHGRNKRRILDFILGFILIFLANGKWTFL